MFPIRVNGFGALLSFAIIAGLLYGAYQLGKQQKFG